MLIDSDELIASLRESWRKHVINQNSEWELGWGKGMLYAISIVKEHAARQSGKKEDKDEDVTEK